MEELKSIRADDDQRREMQEILKRVHEAGIREAEALEHSDDEGSEDEGPPSALSQETLRRLLAKVRVVVRYVVRVFKVGVMPGLAIVSGRVWCFHSLAIFGGRMRTGMWECPPECA